MEGPGADSEEKHEPASDIDTALMDSLKVLDPEGPIREADIGLATVRTQSVTHIECYGTLLGLSFTRLTP